MMLYRSVVVDIDIIHSHKYMNLKDVFASFNGSESLSFRLVLYADLLFFKLSRIHTEIVCSGIFVSRITRESQFVRQFPYFVYTKK